eukprot:244694_1
MSVLHLFAIEHGISGQVNMAAAPEVQVQSSAQQPSPQYRYSANYSNVASIEFAKHSKKQSFFYIVEAEYFPSTYLNASCDDILTYCPLHPMKQSLFGQDDDFKLQVQDAKANEVPQQSPDVDAYNVIDEEEQMRLAIQQSLMDQPNNNNNIANEQRMEMVHVAMQPQQRMDPMQVAMNDPSLQNLDPKQRRKVVKQRLKAQEELAFQESIKNLPEFERQQAIYDRIKQNNKRKQEKQKRRADMLQDPTADQVAQQHAILAQIAAQKASGGVQPAPMAFGYQ